MYWPYKSSGVILYEEQADTSISFDMGGISKEGGIGALCLPLMHITDNFYNCTPEISKGLGDLYVNDERFTKNIDKYKPGLHNFCKKQCIFIAAI